MTNDPRLQQSERFVREAARDGAVRPATITWTRDGDTHRVEIRVDTEHWVGSGPDAFSALTATRAGMERDGWRIGVQGARRGNWVSGQALDQGAGRHVYVLSTTGRPELVGTFEPAPLAEVVAFEEQAAAARDIIDRPVVEGLPAVARSVAVGPWRIVEPNDERREDRRRLPGRLRIIRTPYLVTTGPLGGTGVDVRLCLAESRSGEPWAIALVSTAEDVDTVSAAAEAHARLQHCPVVVAVLGAEPRPVATAIERMTSAPPDGARPSFFRRRRWRR